DGGANPGADAAADDRAAAAEPGGGRQPAGIGADAGGTGWTVRGSADAAHEPAHGRAAVACRGPAARHLVRLPRGRPGPLASEPPAASAPARPGAVRLGPLAVHPLGQQPTERAPLRRNGQNTRTTSK